MCNTIQLVYSAPDAHYEVACMNRSTQNRNPAVLRGLSVVFALLLAFGLLTEGALADVQSGSYVSPTGPSINYYSKSGGSLSSLGLLNMNTAYLVTGNEAVNGVNYCIITVNGVTNCYVKESNLKLSSIATDTTAANTGTSANTASASAQAPATSAAIASGSPIGTLLITPAGTTNMRSAAHMASGNIVAQIPKNTTLPFYSTVVPPSGNHVWYYCYDAASGQYGYIVDDCVKVLSMNSGATIAQLPDKTQQVSAPTADPLYSNSKAVGTVRITPKGKTNIRKTAKSDTNNVVAQANQGDVLPYYAVSVVGGNTWYYVYYQPENVFGYVLGSCAELVYGSAAAPQTTPVASSFTNHVQGYIQFTAGNVNMRKTPSTVAKVIGQFTKGEMVPYYGAVLNDGRTWYQVMKDNETGYVLGDFCLTVSASTAGQQNTAGSAAATVTGYLMTTADKVYVRKQASTGAGSYGQVAKAGTVLTMAGGAVNSNGVTWYPVSFNDNIGYIHGAYVSLLNASQVAAYQNGQTVTVTASTQAAAPKSVDYIQTISDKVWIRKSPSTSAPTKGQALLGAVFHFTGTTRSGGAQWYKIDYAGETCYIMAKHCRVLTDVEYASYQNANANANTNANNGNAAAPVVDQSSKAVTVMDKVIMRAEGRSNAKQISLIYRSGQLCNLLGNTVVSGNYTWYNVEVNGVTGWIRGDLLRILTTAEAAAYTAQNNGSSGGSSGGSSVGGVTLYKPELIDWNTGGIQTIFGKGDVAVVTDVKTGISFNVKRWSGGDHADVEPLTAADTAAMCRIYGVSKAQEISDKNLYQRHPILVTLKGHSYAASMYGVPHNYPQGDTIANNNFNGQFCIHFVNSRVHKSNKVDSDHQKAIMYAYENAASLLGIK